MNRYALALTATSALIAAFATPAEAQIFGRRGNAETTQVINETPRCTQNLGTVAIAETQGVLFDQMGLGAPTELLRTVIRESGCFTLIERGPGMDLVERERSLGGGARVRTADFVLVAELANPIEPTDNDRGSGLLGSLAAVGGRALLTAGLAAATGGEMGGGLGGFGGLGASLNPLQMQALNAATNMAGNVLGGQGGQAAQGPASSLNANTVERIRDLKKDIGRGKEDAQVVFSLASVPLAETVGNTRAVANKGDLRSLRIRDNHFGGRVGAGYESEEEGKIIALAMVRGYADLVTSLGGTGSQIPEVTRANREAIAAETANREAEARRVAAEERRELERAEREREAERRRIRDEIRREEDDRRRYAERPSMSPSMSSRSLALPTILRAAPDGETIRPLAAREVVFPTGKERGGWIEVLDSDDNIGWVQNERLAPAR